MADEQQPAEAPPAEGWMWLQNSPKWHYFVDEPGLIRSLCRRFGAFILVDLEQGNDGSESNCAGCKRALQKRRAKQAEPAP